MRRKLLSTSVFAVLLLFIPLHIQAQTVALDLPYYEQGKDSPWADEKIGNKSQLTIRTHGCALTCISMITSHFSREELTPSKMNKWLKKHDGFQDAWNDGQYLGQISMNWPALAHFRDGWVYTRFDWAVLPADILLIKYYLGQDIPVIAEVVYRNAPHYIVLTGYDEKGFMMNDPEFPDKHRFEEVYNIEDKWGSGAARNINGIRVLYPNPIN